MELSEEQLDVILAALAAPNGQGGPQSAALAKYLNTVRDPVFVTTCSVYGTKFRHPRVGRHGLL